jgi:4-hydroxy-2-oxoheptanedioate aldolase
MVRAAEAAGLESWIRVPVNRSDVVASALNLGAKGIIIPHVASVTDAEVAVRHAKFHPQGLRNWFSKARDARYGIEPTAAFIARRNSEVKLIVQLEDPEAFDDVDAIIGVAGVDVIMTGPGDLAHAYGIPGNFDDLRIQSAERRVFEAADRLGKPVLHFASSREERAELKRRHRVDYLVIGSDTGLMISALRQRLAEMKP